MAGPRQPTDLLVLKGNKHLTKAETEARRAAEVKAPPPKSKRVKPPAYLPESLHKKFRTLAKQLIEIGILAEIDYDCLGARYLLAEQAYRRSPSRSTARSRIRRSRCWRTCPKRRRGISTSATARRPRWPDDLQSVPSGGAEAARGRGGGRP